MRRADETLTVLMRPLQALSVYTGSNLMEHLIPCPKFIQIKGIFHVVPDSPVQHVLPSASSSCLQFQLDSSSSLLSEDWLQVPSSSVHPNGISRIIALKHNHNLPFSSSNPAMELHYLAICKQISQCGMSQLLLAWPQLPVLISWSDQPGPQKHPHQNPSYVTYNTGNLLILDCIFMSLSSYVKTLISNVMALGSGVFLGGE